MMLKYDRDTLAVVCDDCETIEPIISTTDYSEASKIIRAKGWKIENIRGEYLHLCPKCNAKEAFEK
jgi:Fe2+ or Zn2+ uptake regulation protein